jgi:predicted RecA/RadA family phage recombinase
MTARFIHDGNAIDHTPGSDVAAGDVVVQGELVAIAKRAITANTLGALHTVGVFDLPKATGGGSAIGAGVEVYWDEGEQVAKTDAETGSNKKLGKTVAAAADADTTVRIRLSQ